MKTDNNTNATRSKLIDMITGERSGYWAELRQDMKDGGTAYVLHYPNRPCPEMPTEWDGIRAQMKYATGNADDAEQLPRYDDGKTCNGYYTAAEMEAIQAALKIREQRRRNSAPTEEA